MNSHALHEWIPDSLFTRLRRAGGYVGTMFPPTLLVPLGFAQFFSLYFGFQALVYNGPMRISAHAVVGAASTVLWMLLVRLQDDLSDAAHDRRMASLGDPRYRNRPIVTGAITTPELRTIYHATAVVMFGINAVFGLTLGMATCAIGFAITWLGFRWFFVPALAANPTPLAYLGRKSLTVLLSSYTLAVFVDDFRITIGAVAIPLLLAPTAGVAAWEISRKIRIPSDETAYQTYSKAFGWRVAGWLPALFVTLSFACIGYVALIAGLPPAFTIALGGAAALTTVACIRFQIAPSRKSAKLEPFVQLYGFVAHGGLVVTLVVYLGVRFS